MDHPGGRRLLNKQLQRTLVPEVSNRAILFGLVEKHWSSLSLLGRAEHLQERSLHPSHGRDYSAGFTSWGARRSFCTAGKRRRRYVSLGPNHQSRTWRDYRAIFGGSSVLYRCVPSPISGQFSGIEPWFYCSTQIFRFKPDKARAPETRISSPRNPFVPHVRKARP